MVTAMNRVYKYSTFFLSYTPLWISILFIDLMSVFYYSTSSPWTERISIALIAVGYTISIPNMLISLRKIGKEGSERYTIKEVHEEKTAAMEYLLSFILPMFAFDFTQWNQVVLFLIYFAVVGFLCIKHNLLVANIILEVAEYRFYRIVASKDYNVRVERNVITRAELVNMKEEEVYLAPMNDDWYYDVSKKK